MQEHAIPTYVAVLAILVSFVVLVGASYLAVA